jgi:hypothetical protein
MFFLKKNYNYADGQKNSRFYEIQGSIAVFILGHHVCVCVYLRFFCEYFIT